MSFDVAGSVQDSHRVDGLDPSETVRVKSESDVCAALRDAHAAESAVIPCSGGTRISIGNVPEAYDVALDLSGLNSKIEHVAGDMTVVCDAGVRVGDVEEIMRAQGQRLPFLVPRGDDATIGGSVASNAPSRLRPMFGGIRDWVIGMRVILADGTATKSGGRVVKNVQGFDLHRLHTGAYGTLGVIVEVALKLVPVARSSRTVALWFDQVETADETAREIGMRNLNVESARLYVGGRATGMIRDLAANRYMDSGDDSQVADTLLLVKLNGSWASLERQTQELMGLAGTVPALGYERLDRESDAESWDYMEAPIDGSGFRAQLALKPSDSLKVLNGLKRIADREGLSDGFAGFMDVGHGSATVALNDVTADFAAIFASECIGSARMVGGSALIEECPTEAKKGMDVFGIDDGARGIMMQMKREFDPRRILNRGRYAFRI